MLREEYQIPNHQSQCSHLGTGGKGRPNGLSRVLRSVGGNFFFKKANFIRSTTYPTEIVVVGGATGDAGEQDHNAIILWRYAVRTRVRPVAKQAGSRARDEAGRVDVEGGHVALAKLLLHCRL